MNYRSVSPYDHIGESEYNTVIIAQQNRVIKTEEIERRCNEGACSVKDCTSKQARKCLHCNSTLLCKQHYKEHLRIPRDRDIVKV